MITDARISGKACGAIGCVGVSSKSRNTGTGLALVASALEGLVQRGADGCFVDWVALKGWYEKVGFVKWRRGYHDSFR
jgi:beta-N-acetylhexosaminidase